MNTQEPIDFTYSNKKYLIITADDLGGGKAIDEGILLGVEKGIINTISAFTNFHDSQKIIIDVAKKYAHINIGLHLNITSGTPASDPKDVPTLVDSEGSFFTIDELLKRLSLVNIKELELEFANQIKRFQKTQVLLDHISFHHNIMVIYPDFFDAVISVTKDLNVPIRNPMPISIEDEKTFGDSGTVRKGRRIAKNFFFSQPFKAIHYLQYGKKNNFESATRKLNRYGMTYPDHMIDYIYGQPTPKKIIYMLNNLPEGISEIIFHLGVQSSEETEKRGIDKEYMPIREQELFIATSAYLKNVLDSMNIEIIGYKDIKRLKNEQKPSIPR